MDLQNFKEGECSPWNAARYAVYTNLPRLPHRTGAVERSSSRTCLLGTVRGVVDALFLVADCRREGHPVVVWHLQTEATVTSWREHGYGVKRHERWRWRFRIHLSVTLYIGYRVAACTPGSSLREVWEVCEDLKIWRWTLLRLPTFRLWWRVKWFQSSPKMKAAGFQRTSHARRE